MWYGHRQPRTVLIYHSIIQNREHAQPRSAALRWAPCWPVARHEKRSILIQARGDIMGVFTTSMKPTGQMEMEEEVYGEMSKIFGIISLEQMTMAQFPLVTESCFGLREVNGFALFSCS